MEMVKSLEAKPHKEQLRFSVYWEKNILWTLVIAASAIPLAQQCYKGHRITGLRGLRRSLVQPPAEIRQRQRLHHLFGQPLQLLTVLMEKKIPPHMWSEPLLFQFIGGQDETPHPRPSESSPATFVVPVTVLPCGLQHQNWTQAHGELVQSLIRAEVWGSQCPQGDQVCHTSFNLGQSTLLSATLCGHHIPKTWS